MTSPADEKLGTLAVFLTITSGMGGSPPMLDLSGLASHAGEVLVIVDIAAISAEISLGDFAGMGNAARLEVPVAESRLAAAVRIAGGVGDVAAEDARAAPTAAIAINAPSSTIKRSLGR